MPVPPIHHLVPCAACGCHARASEDTCPQCGNAMRAPDGSQPRTKIAVLMGLTAALMQPLACGSDVETKGDTTSSVTGTGGEGGTSAQGTGGSGGDIGTTTSTGFGGDIGVSSAYGVGPSTGGFGGYSSSSGDTSVGGAYGAGPSVGGGGGAGGEGSVGGAGGVGGR